MKCGAQVPHIFIVDSKFRQIVTASLCYSKSNRAKYAQIDLDGDRDYDKERMECGNTRAGAGGAKQRNHD